MRYRSRRPPETELRGRLHDLANERRRFGYVTHECLGSIPDTSISGHRVARELTAIIERRGKPGMIVSDNGTELTSHARLENTGDKYSVQ